MAPTPGDIYMSTACGMAGMAVAGATGPVVTPDATVPGPGSVTTLLAVPVFTQTRQAKTYQAHGTAYAPSLRAIPTPLHQTCQGSGSSGQQQVCCSRCTVVTALLSKMHACAWHLHPWPPPR